MNKASKFVVDAIQFLEKKFDAQEKLEEYRNNRRPKLQFFNGIFEVQDNGNLYITGGIYSSHEALRIAEWLIDTFGDQKKVQGGSKHGGWVK